MRKLLTVLYNAYQKGRRQMHYDQCVIACPKCRTYTTNTIQPSADDTFWSGLVTTKCHCEQCKTVHKQTISQDRYREIGEENRKWYNRLRRWLVKKW